LGRGRAGGRGGGGRRRRLSRGRAGGGGGGGGRGGRGGAGGRGGGGGGGRLRVGGPAAAVGGGAGVVAGVDGVERRVGEVGGGGGGGRREVDQQHWPLRLVGRARVRGPEAALAAGGRVVLRVAELPPEVREGPADEARDVAGDRPADESVVGVARGLGVGGTGGDGGAGAPGHCALAPGGSGPIGVVSPR